MQPARTVGLVQFHQALVVRRGLASFARDVRDDADLALELLEIHGVALNISTDEVVEGAVVRALRVLAVNKTHGCGEEAAARSESAAEHAAILRAISMSWPASESVALLPQIRLLAPQGPNL